MGLGTATALVPRDSGGPGSEICRQLGESGPDVAVGDRSGSDRGFLPSKPAVAPLTRFLAAALAPEGPVNCVAPGLVVDTGPGSGSPEAMIGRRREAATLGVTTAVEDVAVLVPAFCQSPTTKGQTVIVDGGIHDG